MTNQTIAELRDNILNKLTAKENPYSVIDTSIDNLAKDIKDDVDISQIKNISKNHIIQNLQ